MPTLVIPAQPLTKDTNPFKLETSPKLGFDSIRCPEQGLPTDQKVVAISEAFLKASPLLQKNLTEGGSTGATRLGNFHVLTIDDEMAERIESAQNKVRDVAQKLLKGGDLRGLLDPEFIDHCEFFDIDFLSAISFDDPTLKDRLEGAQAKIKEAVRQVIHEENLDALFDPELLDFCDFFQFDLFGALLLRLDEDLFHSTLEKLNEHQSDTHQGMIDAYQAKSTQELWNSQTMHECVSNQFKRNFKKIFQKREKREPTEQEIAIALNSHPAFKPAAHLRDDSARRLRAQINPDQMVKILLQTLDYGPDHVEFLQQFANHPSFLKIPASGLEAYFKALSSLLPSEYEPSAYEFIYPILSAFSKCEEFSNLSSESLGSLLQSQAHHPTFVRAFFDAFQDHPQINSLPTEALVGALRNPLREEILEYSADLSVLLEKISGQENLSNISPETFFDLISRGTISLESDSLTALFNLFTPSQYATLNPTQIQELFIQSAHFTTFLPLLDKLGSFAFMQIKSVEALTQIIELIMDNNDYEEIKAIIPLASSHPLFNEIPIEAFSKALLALIADPLLENFIHIIRSHMQFHKISAEILAQCIDEISRAGAISSSPDDIGAVYENNLHYFIEAFKNHESFKSLDSGVLAQLLTVAPTTSYSPQDSQSLVTILRILESRGDLRVLNKGTLVTLIAKAPNALDSIEVLRAIASHPESTNSFTDALFETENFDTLTQATREQFYALLQTNSDYFRVYVDAIIADFSPIPLPTNNFHHFVETFREHEYFRALDSNILGRLVGIRMNQIASAQDAASLLFVYQLIESRGELEEISTHGLKNLIINSVRDANYTDILTAIQAHPSSREAFELALFEAGNIEQLSAAELAGMYTRLLTHTPQYRDSLLSVLGSTLVNLSHAESLPPYYLFLNLITTTPVPHPANPGETTTLNHLIPLGGIDELLESYVDRVERGMNTAGMLEGISGAFKDNIYRQSLSLDTLNRLFAVSSTHYEDKYALDIAKGNPNLLNMPLETFRPMISRARLGNHAPWLSAALTTLNGNVHFGAILSQFLQQNLDSIATMGLDDAFFILSSLKQARAPLSPEVAVALYNKSFDLKEDLQKSFVSLLCSRIAPLGPEHVEGLFLAASERPLTDFIHFVKMLKEAPPLEPEHVEGLFLAAAERPLPNFIHFVKMFKDALCLEPEHVERLFLAATERPLTYFINFVEVFKAAPNLKHLSAKAYEVILDQALDLANFETFKDLMEAFEGAPALRDLSNSFLEKARRKASDIGPNCEAVFDRTLGSQASLGTQVRKLLRSPSIEKFRGLLNSAGPIGRALSQIVTN